MLKGISKKFKKGAASFYIVAFATLILVVIASSFAIVIVSEIARTSNDDLSQSAYDAALAGVEDAKLAYANYRACLEKQASYPDALTEGGGISCQDIVYYMRHPDCDMVAHMLGRIGKNESSEVLIQETTQAGGSSNNINEAYTCAIIETTLSDYRASLSSSNLYKIVKVDLEKISAADIKEVRVSWYSNTDGSIYNFTNFSTDLSKVTFQSLKSAKVATPPTISVGLIQTAGNFTLNDLNGMAKNGQTDRATVYLVPTNNKDAAKASSPNNYVGIYNGDMNKITKEQIVSTNDHAKDLPYVVYCDPDSSNDFVCSAVLELPEAIGGGRNDKTFMFVVALPYEQPDTDFSLEFLCGDGKTCSNWTNSDGSVVGSELAMMDGVQVVIDSTGRANDLYRRVEMRLESTDSTFAYPMYAIQVLGGETSGEVLLKKDMTVTKEYNTWTETIPSEDVNYQNTLTIYPVVDGVEYKNGRSGFRFNVYADGRLIANNVETWSQKVDNGSHVEIVPNDVSGYTVDGNYEFDLENDETIRVAWKTRRYTVDVNPVINGKTYNNGVRGFVFDVYLNNVLAKENVMDFYDETIPYGTVVKVVPKSRSNCNGGIVEKTVTGNTTINPTWQGGCIYRVDVNSTVHGVNYPNGKEGFTFNVYLDGALVGENVIDFNDEIAVDTKVEIKAKEVAGYDLYNGDVIFEKLKNNQNVVLNWLGAPNLIQFDANGGSWEPYQQACYLSIISKCVITNAQPARSGYRFLGWSTNPSATVAEYVPPAGGGEFVIDVTGDMILYAVWGEQNETITITASWTSSNDYDSYMKLSKPGQSGYQDANWGTTKILVSYNGQTYSLIVGEGDGRGSINGRYYERFTINTLGGKNYYYSMYNWSNSGTMGSDITVTVSGPYLGTKTFYSSNRPGGSCTYWNVFAYKDGRVVEKNTCTSSMGYDY